MLYKMRKNKKEKNKDTGRLVILCGPRHGLLRLSQHVHIEPVEK